MTQNQTNKHMRCHVLSLSSLSFSLSLSLLAKYLPASLAKYTFKTETETKSLHFYLYRWEYIGYRNPFIINLSKFTCLIASCQLLPTICFLPLWKKTKLCIYPPISCPGVDSRKGVCPRYKICQCCHTDALSYKTSRGYIFLFKYR